MTDLAIHQVGDQWDFAVEHGDFVLVDGPAEVAQRITYRLMTWLGESVYDTTAGVPYVDGVFGSEPVPGVAQLIVEVVRGTEGVAQVLPNWSIELDGDGLLTLTGDVLAAQTVVPIDLTVSAV